MIIQFFREDGDYGRFSNFYPDVLEFVGRCFQTPEHLYQSLKVEHNPTVFDAVASALTPHDSKKMAHQNKHFWRPDWETSCPGQLCSPTKNLAMMVVLSLRCIQHPEFLYMLKDTGDVLLEEASPFDAYWGTGTNGDGENHLGKCLMQIRANPSLIDLFPSSWRKWQV